MLNRNNYVVILPHIYVCYFSVTAAPVVGIRNCCVKSASPVVIVQASRVREPCPQQTWAASSSNIYNFPVFPPEMRYFSRSELAIVLLQFYLPSKLFDFRWENKFIQTNLIIPVCVLASFTRAC